MYECDISTKYEIQCKTCQKPCDDIPQHIRPKYMVFQKSQIMKEDLKNKPCLQNMKIIWLFRISHKRRSKNKPDA